ncbi:Serine/threonine-protein kinase AfsK [Actinomadura rubteroloni]|uniref:Serine/threonine-protein kinase AfsK n=1 Tax=Actinomadura rubteroloni TaxID=1926885 RepID=A0A2P4UI17_9ACTN|nr:hypothetical protein [Actinomadura rubteroloni]POM24638.1 Serine/threonine-protein kinase AfsK [Actinomadura rubteroloni]
MSGETRERLGEYRLLRPLSDGAHGGYRAAGPDGRDVAIRFLRPEEPPPDVARLAAIRSPYAADVLDGGTDAGTAYLVFRFVPGRPLTAELAEQGAVRGGALRTLALGLAKALAAIHAEGLAHGALGPDTILVVDGAPVVIDVGLVPGDPAADLAAWARTVTAAAGEPPAPLARVLRTAAEPGATAADLVTEVAALDLGTTPVPSPRPAEPSARPAAAPPAHDESPVRAEGGVPVRGVDDARARHELAVAHGWARLLAVLVVVIAAGVSVLAPVPGTVLSLGAVTVLRATGVRPRAWGAVAAVGRTVGALPYAAAVAVAGTLALIGLAVGGAEIEPLDAAALGAGAGTVALWTAPGASLPRKRLERAFLRTARVPHRIAAAGIVLGLAAFVVLAAALSLQPSFAPLYGTQSSLEASLARLQARIG